MRPEKTQFFCSKFCNKCLKMPFWPGFSKISKQILYSYLGELRKLIWLIIKKGRQNFPNFFEKSQPPRENPEAAPVEKSKFFWKQNHPEQKYSFSLEFESIFEKKL